MPAGPWPTHSVSWWSWRPRAMTGSTERPAVFRSDQPTLKLSKGTGPAAPHFRSFGSVQRMIDVGRRDLQWTKSVSHSSFPLSLRKTRPETHAAMPPETRKNGNRSCASASSQFASTEMPSKSQPRKWHQPARTMTQAAKRAHLEISPCRAVDLFRRTLARTQTTKVVERTSTNCVSFARPSKVEARYGSSRTIQIAQWTVPALALRRRSPSRHVERRHSIRAHWPQSVRSAGARASLLRHSHCSRSMRPQAIRSGVRHGLAARPVRDWHLSFIIIYCIWTYGPYMSYG